MEIQQGRQKTLRVCGEGNIKSKRQNSRVFHALVLMAYKERGVCVEVRRKTRNTECTRHFFSEAEPGKGFSEAEGEGGCQNSRFSSCLGSAYVPGANCLIRL